MGVFRLRRHMRVSVFKVFLITYMIIIFFLTLVYSFTYIKLFDTIDTYEDKNLDSLLNQTCKTMSQYMDEIDSLPKQLMSNKSICRFLSENVYNAGTTDYNPYGSLEIADVLNTYRETNLLLDEILLFSPYHDKILTCGASFQGQTGYGTLFSLENLTFEGMKSSFLQDYSYHKLIPEMQMTLSGEKRQDILHITSLNPYNTATNGSVIIFINSQRLLELLQQSYGDTQTCIYLYGPDGQLLTKSGNAPELNYADCAGRKIQTLDGAQYLTLSTSNPNTWNLAIATPYRYMLRNSFSLKLFIISVLMLSILACIILAIGFSRFNFQPIRQIIQTLSPEQALPRQAAHNEYDVITYAIRDLMNNEQYVREEFERNLPTLRINFVQTLLAGGFASDQDIFENAEKLRVNIGGKSFLALLICLKNTELIPEADRLEKISLTKRLICDSFSGKARCLSSDYSTTGLVLVLGFERRAPDENLLLIEETIQDVSGLLYQSQKIQLVSAAGTFCDSLSNLFYSYEHAKDCLENGIQTTLENNTWCTQNTTAFSWYYYPIEVGNKLINTFQSGNLEGVYEILDNIFDENYRNRILSGHMITCLYQDLKSTVYKLLDKSFAGPLPDELGTLLGRMDPNLPMREFFQIAKDVFQVMTDHQKETEGDALASSILNYVNTEALSPGFGRQSFAEHFYISEDYVSKYFKENTGSNFLEYVTKIRMDTAQKMLLEGNYTVDKIALAVGYSSSVSFRRAFKAYTGITPSEFQHQNIN